MDAQKTIDTTEEIVTEVTTEEAATEQHAPVSCPGCGTEIPEGVKFCPNCGAHIENKVAEPILCNGCGTEIPENMNFCPNCGMPSNPQAKKSTKKKPILIGITAVALAIIVGLVIFLMAPKEQASAEETTVPEEIPVEVIVLSESELKLKEEDIFTVSCSVYPQDATDKKVVWTSSDEKIATVNDVGVITAVGKGECVITAQCGAVKEEINITVTTKIDFKALYETLDQDIKYGWSAGSDGSYLSADTNVYDLDDYSNSNIWASIKEMNKTLGLPASLTEDMKQTTWSMGRQNQQFASIGIEVTWTYHPDKGMEVTYKLLVE